MRNNNLHYVYCPLSPSEGHQSLSAIFATNTIFVLHLNLDECKWNKHYWLDRRGSLAIWAVVVCLSARNIIASGKYAAGPYSFPTVNAFFFATDISGAWSRKYGSLNWITHLSACQNHKAGASYCMHNAPFYMQVPPSNSCGSSSSSPNSLY